MVNPAPTGLVSSKNSAPYGLIRWEVDKDSISTENNTYSKSIEVGGMRWCLYARKHKHKDEEYLALYLSRRKGDYKVHCVNADITTKLINHENDAESIKDEYSEKSFDNNISSWGSCKLAEWDTISGEEKGFELNNKFTVESVFSLISIEGFRKVHKIDFTDPNEPCFDITLLIEGKKIHASKAHLAYHSSVFKSMFYGDFAEKNQKEIELKDINCKEFIEMLKVIYPLEGKTIYYSNYEYLLKLADRFQIDLIVDQVEQFLISSNKSDVAKLVLAGSYRLFALRDHCFDKLKTAKDVADLKKLKESKNFSDAINLALLDKIVKLTI